MSDRVFGGCGIVGIRVAGSERDVEPDVGTDFSNFVSVIPDRVAVFYFVLDTRDRFFFLQINSIFDFFASAKCK